MGAHYRLLAPVEATIANCCKQVETREHFVDNVALSEFVGQIVASVRKSALVQYSAAQMFALVNDIETYPRFLPWCRATQVHLRNEDEVRATIEIAKGAVRKSFTTINRLQQNKMIEISLVDGPFRRLDGYWRFEALREDACKVSLDLDFEFAGRLLQAMVGPVFSQIADSMVESFCKRAAQVYG